MSDNRPYFDFLVTDMEKVFHQNMADFKCLTDLKFELKNFRKKKGSVMLLLGKVNNQLAILEKERRIKELERVFENNRENTECLDEIKLELEQNISIQGAKELLVRVSNQLILQHLANSIHPQDRDWSIWNDLLHFSSLSVDTNELVSVYTIGWRFDKEVDDKWTKIINRFKFENDDENLQLSAEVLEEAIKRILNSNNLDISNTGIISAIPSKYTTLPHTHKLFKVGCYIESNIGTEFLNKYLTKKIHKKLHRIKGKEKRDAEVHEVYNFNKLVSNNNIIIIDDIVTRGSTMRDIRRAIKLNNESIRFIGLALGRQAPGTRAEQIKWKLNNDHVYRLARGI